jgi:hypothetical protein
LRAAHGLGEGVSSNGVTRTMRRAEARGYAQPRSRTTTPAIAHKTMFTPSS